MKHYTLIFACLCGLSSAAHAGDLGKWQKGTAEAVTIHVTITNWILESKKQITDPPDKYAFPSLLTLSCDGEPLYVVFDIHHAVKLPEVNFTYKIDNRRAHSDHFPSPMTAHLSMPRA